MELRHFRADVEAGSDMQVHNCNPEPHCQRDNVRVTDFVNDNGDARMHC